MPDAGVLFSTPHSIWDSRRLWSLWDMMNFTLGTFWDGLKHLQYELAITRENVKSGNGLALIEDEDRSRLQRNMQFAIHRCVDELQIETAERVCSEIRFGLQKPICTWMEINTLLEELWKTLEWEMKQEHFFHYKRDDVRRLETIETDWQKTLQRFSVKDEAIAALDCYGFRDFNACIFHLMRIAEIGLRALAKERAVSFPDKPIEWAEWQHLIDQISAKGKAAAQSFPVGQERDAARDFYSGAVHHFEGFKDKYRNSVMHMRRNYDELDALRSINQVRDFMNGLSAKISEKTRGPIKRWP